MKAKAYEIELLFTTGGAYRLKRHFTTQKAAREWCARSGMSPIFGGSRPAMFWSSAGRDGRHGIQATIYAEGSRTWPAGSTEGRYARAARRAYL